jgi:hypothetical protein
MRVIICTSLLDCPGLVPGFFCPGDRYSVNCFSQINNRLVFMNIFREGPSRANDGHGLSGAMVDPALPACPAAAPLSPACDITIR